MQLIEQQQNLNTYLNNIPYEHKQQVHSDLKRFVQQNEYFWCRTNVQRNQMDQYFSFIEAVGFITIGRNMVEIRIMIPHNYPLAAPQFDIVYNSDSYEIPNQPALVASQTIAIRDNAQGDHLVRVNSRNVANIWLTPSRRSVIEAFAEISRQLNSPPLLVPVNKDANVIKSIKNISMRHSLSNGLTEKVMSEVEEGIFSLQEKQMTVQGLKVQNEYKEARADFIQRNAGKLQKVLRSQEQKVNAELEQMRSKHEQMVIKNNIDPLLVMTPKDQAKVQAFARRDAVKEAERKLVQCLQGNLSEGKGRWEEHKGMIRLFYEQMFEAEQMYLKACD